MDFRINEERMSEEFEASLIKDNFTNIVISDNPDKELCDLIFSDEPWDVLPGKADIFDILVFAKCFPSRGQAKNNWKKTDRIIETGCTAFVVGKKKLAVCIFKSAIEFENNL